MNEKICALLALTYVFFSPLVFAEDSGPKGSDWKPRGRGGPMQHFQAMDGDQDGKISKTEFLKPKEEKFNEADKNKDGFIDKEELQGLMESFGAKHQNWRGQEPGGSEPK